MLTPDGQAIAGAVSAGYGKDNSAVVTSNGKLYTAGNTNVGGSGTNYLVEKTLPAGKVAGRVIVAQLSIFVIMTDGTVWCLGTNWWASMGLGNSNNPAGVFAQTLLPSACKDLKHGNDGTVFLLTNGDVYFAGNNAEGGRGNGTTGGAIVETPVRVSTFTGKATAIGANWYDTYYAFA